MVSKAETSYQAHVVDRLQTIFPDCQVLYNDPSRIQGIPDILVLWGPHWAMLEVKISDKADIQPNQEYYVGLFNEMSFASFIFPEVEEEVLSALQSAFGING